MKSRFPSVTFRLPDWIDAAIPVGQVFATIEDRMALAITLARLNVENGTGGPFGALIFNSNTGEVISPGVNMVVPTSTSIAHAEIVAVSIGGVKLGAFNLGSVCDEAELVTSVEPCAMCFGAIPWSGVRRVVCGARDSDARLIGFDEGPKMAKWDLELQRRGIDVIRDVHRQGGVEVLNAYANGGGPIYNGRIEQ